ncbi:YrhB domain-containing protein [Snodgrassella alvi]|uniref:YrhB domain-containing protein n=1 Tax=Snodgrassella alvi TaxID=1196083 RepID=UPI0034610456
MITFKQALNLAKKYIEEIDSTYEINYLGRFSEGWFFCYQSGEYLETGNTSYLLAGNSPIIIDKDSGVIVETGTIHPIEKYLEEYVEKKRNDIKFNSK